MRVNEKFLPMRFAACGEIKGRVRDTKKRICRRGQSKLLQRIPEQRKEGDTGTSRNPPGRVLRN